MKLDRFFDRSLGTWESHRTYMYLESNKIESLVTCFTWTNPFIHHYDVTWFSERGEGGLNCTFKNDELIERSNGYFTKHPTFSKVLEVSYLVLHTITEYNNMSFNERITFLDDEHRTRHTLGYKQNADKSLGKLILSGCYQEKKI